MNDWIGRTLSKVRIERPLGRGGMAEVFLGRHSTLNRPVAVKILHAHLQEDEEFRRRFQAEAQAVAALRHPNIVQVLDFDVVEDRPYIIMELLGGMPLDRYLAALHKQRTTLPMPRIVHLIKGLAAALDYAHKRGIVHRDVKPANIMLRQGAEKIEAGEPLPADVEPVLTDFGVARLASATTQTATGTVLGTPAYMSPEQVRGEKIDSRSDIYSLGIVLYELLSGDPPFWSDTTPAAVLVKQLNEEPPPLPKTSPPIQAVVRKALAKNVDSRYQRAGEFAEGLRRAVHGETPEPTPTRVPAQERSAGSIPQGCWIGGAVAGVLLLVALVAGGIFGLRALTGSATEATPQASDVAAVQTEPTEPVSEPTATVGVTATPSVDPSVPVGSAVVRGSSIAAELAEVPAPPEASAHHVWLQTAAGELIHLGLAQHNGETLSFVFSHDQEVLPQLGQLIISLEPQPDDDPATIDRALYRGELDPELAADFVLLADVTGATDPVQGAIDGLGSQVVHYNSHLGFALEGIRGGSLPSGKQHSEHVINILEGRQGDDYGDWNDDSRTENPGDDVGLLPYLRMLHAMTQVAEPPGAAQSAAASLADLIEQATRARDLATRVAAADTLEEVTPLAEEMTDLRFQPAVQEAIGQIQPLQLGIPLLLFPEPSTG